MKSETSLTEYRTIFLNIYKYCEYMNGCTLISSLEPNRVYLLILKTLRALERWMQDFYREVFMNKALEFLKLGKRLSVFLLLAFQLTYWSRGHISTNSYLAWKTSFPIYICLEKEIKETLNKTFLKGKGVYIFQNIL